MSKANHLPVEPTPPDAMLSESARILAENHPAQDRQIMLRYIEGQLPHDISLALCVPLEHVSKVLRSAVVREEIKRLASLANERFIKERIDNLTIEAMDTMRDTMRGAQISELRFKAAKEFLDKSPILRAQRDISDEVKGYLGEAIIMRLTQLEAEAAARAEEKTIEISVEGQTNET